MTWSVRSCLDSCIDFFNADMITKAKFVFSTPVGKLTRLKDVLTLTSVWELEFIVHSSTSVANRVMNVKNPFNLTDTY